MRVRGELVCSFTERMEVVVLAFSVDKIAKMLTYKHSGNYGDHYGAKGNQKFLAFRLASFFHCRNQSS